jgi:hypothetical protein
MKGLGTTKITALISALGAILCLIIGFGFAGYWEIILFLPAIALYWFFTRKARVGIDLSIILFVYVFLAAIGLLKNVSTYLMIVGCSLALASWESSLFSLQIRDESTSSTNQRLEYLHNKDLIIAIGSGLLIAILGLNVRLYLPFGLIAGLVLLAAYGLYRGFKYY